MSKPFQFKQFSVQQDKTAMKVGTDGVLLGAWATIEDSVNSILDIGSGTGVISLMMAQRSFAETIDAVELNDEAYIQTVENFEQSDWGDRLFCYHASFQQFVDEMEGEEYDLIISNPPFYTSTYKELDSDRAMARHSESLNYKELFGGVVNLLSKNGTFCVVFPNSEESNIIKLAEQIGLYPAKITRVKGTPTSEIKRSLIQFSFNKVEIKLNELIIEIDRHVYTKDYINLVEDFYLKM
ncbi:tRNA1Val (adenine37-N6)-methyltransferase [Lutibacter oricola]|uniref:tRNA1(Val) (adenine(37)-N6)-methyltransferase n=1 Tax=Lutibacter oricola TaxID=762486 RepID=A0A1H2TZH4_9FLAO|nr:methyltransferase [Lutibacter oricola]SDW49352.1 tRNA1Val (adenine37-N6)-methyltransferase [Lutibacter oricola]